jgi:hypothetical protein
MSTAVDEGLARLRETPRYHWLGLVAACLAGLVLASVHPVGLVAGGALVGLVSTTLRRAVLAGLGFGVLVLVAWAGLLVWHGSLGGVLATGQFVALGAAMALGGPLLGSLVRGVV